MKILVKLAQNIKKYNTVGFLKVIFFSNWKDALKEVLREDEGNSQSPVNQRTCM